ncbi:hypothetical protein CEXT_465941 [Caerostris extrusa]|uniref:Secreted protein n=1 Tax=Caerostris extrusa TaxID=172846 RepID=A0AAV4XX89_CAEEX|nr:hypothetical protein CEXT_465941 [Caerostris extrusa]
MTIGLRILLFIVTISGIDEEGFDGRGKTSSVLRERENWRNKEQTISGIVREKQVVWISPNEKKEGKKLFLFHEGGKIRVTNSRRSLGSCEKSRWYGSLLMKKVRAQIFLHEEYRHFHAENYFFSLTLK